MTKIYCLRQKKLTDTKNETFERTKNNRMRIVGDCIECGAKKSKFVSSKEGSGLGDVVLGAIGKTGWELGKVGVKNLLKSDTTKKLAGKYVKSMANKMIDQGLDQTLNSLASNIHTMDGSGLIGSNSFLLPKNQRKTDSVYLKELYKNNPQLLTGGSLDIHKQILKVAPKKGFVMPGHRYTGPGNPLEEQLKYDPNTGQILEIYQKPTGRTDAVSMQHDVDYSVCTNKPKGNQVKCKNEADRKMVKSLDAIPWKERQWGHALARNAIATKAKLGMGMKKSKNGKGRRVKKTGKKN